MLAGIFSCFCARPTAVTASPKDFRGARLKDTVTAGNWPWCVTAAPLAVTHQGQFPAVTVSFNLAPRKSLGDAVTAVGRAQKQLNMPASIQQGFQGTAQAFEASL